MHKKGWWISAGLFLAIVFVLGFVATPAKQFDDLDVFAPYAARDTTTYQSADSINKQYSAMLSGVPAKHAVAMRFVEVRSIRKGDLMRKLEEIAKRRGWKTNDKQSWLLLESATGSLAESNFLVEQLTVIAPGRKDFAHLPEDTKMDCEITESRFLTARDVLGLRARNFGKDPFTHPRER